MQQPFRSSSNRQHVDGALYAASSYPAFPAAVQQHVSPNIAAEFAGFDHHGVNHHAHQSHINNNDHHVANHSAHLSNNALQLDPSLQSEAQLMNRNINSHPDPSDNTHHGVQTIPSSATDPSPPAQNDASPPVDDEPSNDAATADDQQFDMLPPPEGNHPTWAAMHGFAQEHASAHGYAFSINTTSKNRSRIKMACVCYGHPKNTHKLTPETRVRKNRGSHKTGCKMWIEGRRQEDGSWTLKVGYPDHNHTGKPADAWAMQRKRTWMMQGGRIGVGGITAKMERARMGSDSMSREPEDQNGVLAAAQDTSHSHERGGLVWRIVEQEMLKKGSSPGLGRDRGVGRTVKVLKERLPGIEIFKRDVYNIRSQIKRARKAAGQQIGEGLDASGDEQEDDNPEQSGPGDVHSQHRPPNLMDNRNLRGFPQQPEIDPMLVAQCSDALRNVNQQESDVDRLRKENSGLRQTLAQITRQLQEQNTTIQERDAEIENLRVQIGMANNMAFFNARGAHPQ